MRIIAGKLRGKVLAPIRGNDIRPTSDKIRGAIFSSLLSRRETLDGIRVLDMFAGSGALSLEALSRGADLAVLVDKDQASQQLAMKNLTDCGVVAQTRMVRGDVLKSLPRVQSFGPFDLVFIDPPYGKTLAHQALSALASSTLLETGAWVVVETDRNEELPDLFGQLHCDLCKSYGNTAIRYYHYNPA